MKKSFLYVGILVFVMCVFFSFFNAKNIAEKSVSNLKGEISPLKGSLILYINDTFEPCWYFRAEHNSATTGATIDVYVTFFGKIK